MSKKLVVSLSYLSNLIFIGSYGMADTLAISKTDKPLYTTFQQTYLTNKLEIFSSFGVLSVKAQEYRYFYDTYLGLTTNQKISHLIWNTKSIPILKTGLNYHFTPRLTLNALFWVTEPKKNSHMVDYDWAIPTMPKYRSHMSSHSNTKLKANGFDINFKYNIGALDKPHQFAFLFGFKQDRYQWVAPNYGYFEYKLENFYGWWGNNKPIVSYKQTLKVPYLGISHSFIKNNKWEMASNYKFSKFGTIRAVDLHHTRSEFVHLLSVSPGLRTRDVPVSKPWHTSVDITVSYQYSKPIQIFLNAEMSYTPKITANSKWETLKEKYPVYSSQPLKRQGGLQNTAKNFSVGVKYNFK